MADTLALPSSPVQRTGRPAMAGELTTAPLVQVLPHRPQAAARARSLTHTAITARGYYDLEDAALLLVSELVTNAVEHAAPPLVFHLDQPSSDILRISVDDGGPTTHHDTWHASCAEDEHGRGTTLITALANQHGTTHHPDGHSTHWATLSLGPTSVAATC
ncbi:ATP-binding protein [Streptomyces sp. NPDC051133]|uniref:ATP-binding protein n=1 Tax=Streptomyces sp. NPDC051133 TaxID=3155521 RepID=UPI00342E7092